MKIGVILLKLNELGLSTAIDKALGKIAEKYWYPRWIRRKEPDVLALKKQTQSAFSLMPKISIVCPLYNTPKCYFDEMVRSVLDQSYRNFELCLVDAGDNSAVLERVLKTFSDERIRYIKLERNFGIAENTNRAIAMARGEFIAFLDHDDVLSSDSMYEIIKAVNENPNVDFLYSDQDNFTNGMRSRKNPFFKPDFSPDYLLGMNYICHLTVVRKDLIVQIGALQSEFDGSQDYDFALRATKESRLVVHIPKILYHWRIHGGSVASDFETKDYAQQAAISCLKTFFLQYHPEENVNIVAYKEKGRYKPVYTLHGVSVSVIIFLTDEGCAEDCVRAVRECNYLDLEILLTGAKKIDLPGTQYVPSSGQFYEAMYTAAQNAHGEYILFLNDCIMIKDRNIITEMMQYAGRMETGAVGCKLLNSSGSKVVSNGIYFSAGGDVRFSMRGKSKSNTGSFGRGYLLRNVSAVSCWGMVTERRLFLKQKGFLHEAYEKSYGDVDYCNELIKQGKFICVNPAAALYCSNAEKYLSFSETDFNTFRKKNGIQSEHYERKDFFVGGNL